MKIITVIPLKRGPWKENLTYFTSKEIENGNIVVVPLRNKKVLGLVISSEDAAPQKSNIKDMSFNLKKISEVKERSFFRNEYFDAAIMASDYFGANKGSGIASLIPASLRENYDKISEFAGSEAGPGMPGPASPISPKKIRSEKLIFQAPISDRISFYKTLIRGSFAEKKSVFMVLPTEHDIKKFEQSLSRGIEQFVFALHGGLSAKKILKIVEEITATNHPVLILGTASFLSIPRKDTGTVIIEHESSNAYKMISRPHVDLRFFAEIFSAKINAKMIFADSLLRYETIAREHQDGLIPVHSMQFRTNFQGKVDVIDPNKKNNATDQQNMDGDHANSKFKIFAEESIKNIRSSLAGKKSVFVFTLRKGLATITTCRDCNQIVSCEECEAPLVLYSSHKGKQRMFVCNRCEKSIDGEVSCKNCGSWNLMPLGIGTDTVYEEISKVLSAQPGFEKTKIFQLDKESAKTARGAGKIVKDFEENPGSILIGTEMAFFYLKEKIPLSVVASFDSLWSIPSFKMGERIIHILLSIIDSTTGKLIIQTKNENDSAILAIESENLLSFIREELEDRRKLEYPPFKRFIKITYLGDKEQSQRAKKALEEIFKEYSPEIFSGFVSRLKGKYVTNALLRIEPKEWSLPEISAGSSLDKNLLSKLLSLPPSFEIFVDPEDLL